MPRGRRHRDEFPPDSDFEALLVQFAWDAADRMFPPEINRALVALPVVEKRAPKRAALELYDVFRSTQPLAPELSTARLHVLLLTLLNATQRRARRGVEAPPSRAAEVIAEAKEYVEDHLSELVSLTDIATHLGMSPYHLSHVFSHRSGFRLSEYVGHRRMERAAELLGDPKSRVSEVAHAVGFRDPNYFAKAFRRHFDCSPSVYRSRLHREKRQ